MPWCDICQDFSYGSRHEHFPQWEVRVYDTCGFLAWGDEWMVYRARNAQEAARKAAEEYDQEDYPLIRNNALSARALVRQLGHVQAEAFRLHAEAIPTYYADPVPPEDEPE
jgi:hypothetical protein